MVVVNYSVQFPSPYTISMTLQPCFLGDWIVFWWLWSCLDFWSRWSAGSGPTRTSSRYHPELPSGLKNRKNKTKCDIRLAHFSVHLKDYILVPTWGFGIPKIIHFIIDEGNSLFLTHTLQQPFLATCWELLHPNTSQLYPHSAVWLENKRLGSLSLF